MELAIIFLIVGLAFTFLVWKFYRSLQNKEGSQRGCGCSSCPSGNNCGESSPKTAHHIN